MSINTGYIQKLPEDGMALLRSRQTLDEVKQAYSKGSPVKALRSYHLTGYQQEIIEILAKDSGLSKAGVIRQIIDEWYEENVNSVEREAA